MRGVFRPHRSISEANSTVLPSNAAGRSLTAAKATALGTLSAASLSAGRTSILTLRTGGTTVLTGLADRPAVLTLLSGRTAIGALLSGGTAILLTLLSGRTAIRSLLTGRTSVGTLLTGGTRRSGRRRIVSGPAHDLTDCRLLWRGRTAGIRIVRCGHVGFNLLGRLLFFCGGFGSFCRFLRRLGLRFFLRGLLGLFRRLLGSRLSCLGSFFLTCSFHHPLLIIVQHCECFRMGGLRLHLFLLSAACSLFFSLAVHL